MEREREIWFPAKRYGWGWGPPIAWQGWVVLGAYVVAILVSAFRFPPHQDPWLFVGIVAVTTLAFVFVCWWKGETPRWRWGDDS